MMTSVARRRTLQSLVLALGVTALLGGIASAPARADDDWDHHAWREHEWREHEWREHHPYYAYPAPGYAPGYAYMAPPPVIYAPPPPPPPVVYAPTPGFNLVVPIHIR